MAIHELVTGKVPVPGTLVDADQYFKHGHDDTSSGTPVTEEDTVNDAYEDAHDGQR